MIPILLAELVEIANLIPRPGCDWEEQPRFEPPASLESITALERAAGFPIDTDLRDFLTHANAVIGMSIHNGYWIGGIEHMVKWIDSGSGPHEVQGERAIRFATDGGGNAFLLTSSGQIWLWNRETDKVSMTATSLVKFLDRVKEDWRAYVEETPGWNFLI